jgi:hypothetical protein
MGHSAYHYKALNETFSTNTFGFHEPQPIRSYKRNTAAYIVGTAITSTLPLRSNNLSDDA